MSITDYLRDQARYDADHEGVDDWLAYERRLSVADPSAPWPRPNPNYDLLLNYARNFSNVSDHSHGLSTESRWTCTYCGGLRMASAHKCEGVRSGTSYA